MARFMRGDVVVVPFPFSGAMSSKRRPALILGAWAYAGGTDYLTCLISSQAAPDPALIALESDDILGGSLNRQSYLRPLYLFAADENYIVRKVGTLKADKLGAVVQAIIALLKEEN